MEAEAIQRNTENNEKILKILKKLLDPLFKVKNGDNLNKFLTQLACNDDKDKSRQKPPDKQLSEQYCQWIISACNLWGRNKINPPTTILCFTLNLTGLLSCDEHIFVNLNSRNVYESLVGIAQRHEPKDPCIIHGVVTMFSSFLEHKSGVQWVMATTHWMDVINLGLKSRIMSIKEKAYQFVKKLLEKTICFNRNFGVHLVGILLKPIIEVGRSLPNIKGSPEPQVSKEEPFETLKPTLEFISEVTSMLLKSFTTNVLLLFLEQNAPALVEQVLLLSRSEDLCFELLKVQFVFLFFKLCVKLDGVKVVSDDSQAIYDFQIMFDLIKNEMDKNNVKGVIKICDYAHSLYCSVSPRMPQWLRKGEVIEFQNQMVLFQIMPIMVLSIQITCGKDKHPDFLLLNDDFRKSFIRKLLKLAAFRSIEICYKWKLNLQVNPELMEYATFSLQYIVRTKNLLNKERAATIFPCLVYSLRDSLAIITCMRNIDWPPRATEFLCTLVDSMVDFVESFNLTWNDSIETIRVMDLACAFLNYPNWPEKIIVIKGLKLLNLAISKYMCPDMVLLIYSTKDSAVSQSGRLLYDTCHDSCWEVRDSALEVVHTLSSSANTKFPALTQVLVEAKLPQLVIHMALNDAEYTVRTTAFRCLQELIQIPDIWNVLIDVDKFLENLLYVFKNESEGIVRREATTVIVNIYRVHSFPDELLLRLYDVMTLAALEDSYWEVKYKALNFWGETWKTYLTNQGMIDRGFPSHTFSTEHKKIVALNEAEIKKRIIKVLSQLSQIGCLYVFRTALLDNDIKVAKKAMLLTRKVMDFFQTYKIPKEIADLNDELNSMTRRRDSRYEQLFEPMSPASSTTMTALSPADLGNPYSPQFDPVEYFDIPPSLIIPSTDSSISQTSNSQDTQSSQLSNQTSPESSKTSTQSSHISPHTNQTSPYSNNISPSSANHTSPPTNQICPVSNQTSCGVSSYQEKIPGHATPDQTYDQLYDTSMDTRANLDIAPICDMFDVDMLGDGGVNSEQVQFEINANNYEPVTNEDVLNEFLKINPKKTQFREVYNPPSQVKKHTVQVRTKMYLAPTDYVKFVYEAEELAAKRKLNETEDEFESVLDDILSEL